MSAKSETVAAVGPQHHNNQAVLWVIALLLTVIATALVLRTDLPFSAQSAYGDAPMVGARGIFAFTGQIDRNSYGLFMMDVDNSTVWCYQYVPSLGKLRLVAARSFLYDRYLEDHNTLDPSPETVRGMLEEQRRIKSRISQGGVNSDVPLESADLTSEMATDAAVSPAPNRSTTQSGE